MPYNEIFSTELDNYTPIIWGDTPIYNRFKYVINVLNRKLQKDYSYLLAEPKIKGNRASWVSNKLGTSTISLSKLGPVERQHILKAIETELAPLNDFIFLLQDSNDRTNQDLGRLLELAFQIPDESHIIVDKDTQAFSFVAWGFEFIEPSDSIPQRLKLTKKKPLTETPLIPTSEEISPIDPSPKTNSIEPPKIETTVKDKPLEDTNVVLKEEDTANRDPEPKRKNFLPWILGILLSLAILLILYLLLTQSSDRPDSGNPILPPQSDVLPPIDTSKIIVDRDDPLKQQIISNRLNIYLFPGTNVEAFSKQLKQQYPDPNIKIVYYTAASNRLMIECPADQRLSLKKELQDFRNVKFVVDETIFVKEQTSSRYNDPGFVDPQKSWPFEAIQLYDAWKITQGASDVTIAIIDNGFDLNHPELRDKVIHPWNIPTNRRQTDIGLVNMIHGTHVATIAGGEINNAQGIAGIAPNCKIMPIQVGDSFGFMTTSSIIDGIFYALNHGADIINLSLGSSFTVNLKGISKTEQERYAKTLYIEQEAFWTDLFKLMDQEGIIVVQAAGNSNILANVDPMHRNPYTIKVTATDRNDQKAVFSNFGTLCQLSAPGTKIYNAVPNNSYSYLDGTSMAAPMVSGAAALIKSKYPSISPSECERILFETGKEVGPTVGRLIQLADALGYEGIDELPCAEELERLREEIDSLKNQIRDSSEIGLIIPEDPEDLSFAKGFWKSTTDLFSVIDNNKLELYFRFVSDGTGELTILEADGTQCKAPLAVQLFPNKMEIDQIQMATCVEGIPYNPYFIRCISNPNQIATCKAVNKKNSQEVSFQLVKVNTFQ